MVLGAKDLVEKGSAVDPGQQKCGDGPQTDADIVAEKACPRAKQQHARQTSQAAGQDGDHHLHRLEQDEDQGAEDTKAIDKGPKGLLGGEQLVAQTVPDKKRPQKNRPTTVHRFITDLA